MQQPSNDEILKYLTVMDGCPKHQFPEEWIKGMTNWDLLTNPEAEESHRSTPLQEKINLANKWKEYMTVNKCWLSFYEWRKLQQRPSMQMMAQGSSNPCHKWKSLDGSILESKTTFPPFQSIILESDSSQEKACPLLTDTGNQLSGIDKRVQSVTEQLNGTNTSLRGMATQVYQAETHVKPEQIYDL
jgi:hypothetical protein